MHYRYIPCLSKFLANEKWTEVPAEYFESKKKYYHQSIVEDLAQITKQWEQEKKAMINNSKNENTKSDAIEKAWRNFASKFKPEFSYKQYVTKVKFIELYNNGFSFEMIEGNKDITPMEFLKKLKINELYKSGEENV